ncbi:MAG: hypothetical protein AAF467_02405 [Actinomycetota bacterium]
MNNTRLLVAILAAGALTLAACGGDDATVAGGPGDASTTDSTTNAGTDGSNTDDATTDSTINDGNDDASGSDMTDDDAADGASGDASDGLSGSVIGDANIGGEVVDPMPHAIDEIFILESYPEQLSLQFTAGDINCLAADATAAVVGDEIVVELLVGITTDALAKSCVAGEFEHSITIPLTEGLDGRELVYDVGTSSSGGVTEEADDEEQAELEPDPRPFEVALVGLSEAAAREAAEAAGYQWRVVHRDGQDFAVTLDYNENRVNVTIVDSVVVEATRG